LFPSRFSLATLRYARERFVRFGSVTNA